MAVLAACSLVAQIAALVASGGWLIAVKIAQMAVAVGNLVKDCIELGKVSTNATAADAAPPAVLATP